MTDDTAEHGIAVRNVSKRYHKLSLGLVLGRPLKDDGYLAVDDVSFDVARGEIFGLVGPNGAGKTTLIKCICALLHPTTGSVKIEGMDTVRDADKVKRSVGLVTSNERSFYWRLTGQQNLEFFSGIYKLDKIESREWIDRLMEFLGIARYRHERFDSYSTGTKQRFAIARGMLSKPRFLLMDEPTKGVDPVNAKDIIDLIANKMKDFWKPTVLITSHDLREIELLCDHVGVMHKSRLVAKGTVDELAAIAHLSSLQTIRFSGPVTASVAELPEKVRGLTPKIERDTDGIWTLSFAADEGSGALNATLQWLLDRKAVVHSVDRRRQTLDDVFLNIVSR